MEEWQAKRGSSNGAPRLTTGFLDGTHPIVDAYELKVDPTETLEAFNCSRNRAPKPCLTTIS